MEWSPFCRKVASRSSDFMRESEDEEAYIQQRIRLVVCAMIIICIKLA